MKKMGVHPKAKFHPLDITPKISNELNYPTVGASKYIRIHRQIYNAVIAFLSIQMCPTCKVYYSTQTHTCLQSVILIPTLKSSVLGFNVISKTIQEIQTTSKVAKLMRLHNFVYIQNTIYINGESAIHGYNINAHKYKKLRSKISNKIDSAFALGNGLIYTLGGISGKLKTNTCEVYSIANNSWKRMAKMTMERSRCSACTKGGNVYAIGGVDRFDPESVIELYENAKEQWKALKLSYFKGKFMSSVSIATDEKKLVVFYKNQSDYNIARVYPYKAETIWSNELCTTAEHTFSFKYCPIINSVGIHVVSKDLRYIYYDGILHSDSEGNLFESYKSIIIPKNVKANSENQEE